MGLTAAIKNGITFTNGQADQTNYHQYQIMRIDEMPKIEIHIVESGAESGGVGEGGFRQLHQHYAMPSLLLLENALENCLLI